MQIRLWILVLPLAVLLGIRGAQTSGKTTPSLTPAQRTAVADSVRQFTARVAQDVTQAGPIAWSQHFQDSPEFFMAVNGSLAFPNGEAAAQALPQIARVFKHIELHWGDDLRLDPLTETLCVVATSYSEVIELNPGSQGPQGTHRGYFTGLAEKRNGQWQFRDAHWSESVPADKP